MPRKKYGSQRSPLSIQNTSAEKDRFNLKEVMKMSQDPKMLGIKTILLTAKHISKAPLNSRLMEY